MSDLIERVWEGSSPATRLLRALLIPASVIYGFVVSLRAAAYLRGWLASRRAGVPVVSVGNLRVGGTGKTPFVMWLVEALQARGRRVVVVSRGYGGAVREPVAIAAADRWEQGSPAASRHRRVTLENDGTMHGDVELSSIDDEARLVAARVGCPVVTDRDRAAGCSLAEALFAPDLIVLDDGFQHLRLERDLDLVLLTRGDMRARVLPAGPLREPARALARAQIVVGTEPGASHPCIRVAPQGLVKAVRDEPEADEPYDGLRGARVLAVCGIARPTRFFDLVRQMGAQVLATLRFPDHHRYDLADWERIAGAAVGADRIVTTEKDLVKLKGLAADDSRLVALRVSVEVAGGEALLERVLGLDARGRGDNHRHLRDGAVGTEVVTAPTAGDAVEKGKLMQ